MSEENDVAQSLENIEYEWESFAAPGKFIGKLNPEAIKALIPFVRQREELASTAALELAAQFFDKMGCTCVVARSCKQVPDHTVSCATHLAFCIRQLSPSGALAQFEREAQGKVLREIERAAEVRTRHELIELIRALAAKIEAGKS